MFLAVFSLQAQTKSVQGQRANTNETLQLTEENQRFFEEYGVVRCATVEAHELRMQNNPAVQSMDQFESWMSPLVEAKKAQMLQDAISGSTSRVVYDIPIIFHVITGAAGDAYDLDALYINAQIDQLNIDFNNMAGSTHAAAFSADINFIPAQVDPNGNPLAEPGINRVYGYSGAHSQTTFDGGIKQATIWDRAQYANIWTANLSGGLLGYAQFPSNSTLPGMDADGGSAQTDGVVCLYSSIGSVATPYPGGAPYNLGRTLTHEVGHWIGLRHIWGDATCGNDYCADTPQSQSSNGGCPTQTTCDGIQDMVENYMDYTNDACMNIFTFDQVARIITVIENADDFDSLVASTTGNSSPTIAFTTPNVSEVEATSCAMRDIDFPVNIGLGASANATVTFSASGSATNMVDFEILTPTATFAAGSTDSQTLTIRVYEDAFVEGDETIIVDMSLSTTGDAELSDTGSQTLTLTLTDDDVMPSEGGAVTLLEDDFESYDDFIITGIGEWITLDVDGLNTYTGGVGTTADPASYANAGAAMAYQIFNPSTTTPSAATNSDGTDGETRDFDPRSGAKYAAAWAAVPGANPANDDWLVSPVLSLGNSNNAVSFWVKAMSNSYGPENYNVGIYVGSGTPTSGADFTIISAASLTAPYGVWTEDTYDLSAYNNQDVRIGIHCISADRYMFMVDDFTATTYAQDQIQTAVNTATPASLNLKGMGTAYAYNIFENNNIIAKIQNNDTFDYGCATVSVMRGGIGSQVLESPTSSNYVTTKAFSVITDNPNTAGDATLAFYFTEDEIASWESDTGRDRSELVVFREVDGDIIESVPATVGVFGTDVTLEATFTGADGNYYFGPPEALSIGENSFDVFALYPNPTNGEVNVQLSTDQDVNITLYDVRGRKVFANNYNNNNATFNKTINLETISSGLYLIQFESGSKKTTKKLLIK